VFFSLRLRKSTFRWNSVFLTKDQEVPMTRYIFSALFVCTLLLAGRQSMPWQRNTMPPVELLDDESGKSAPEASAPPAASLQPAPKQAPVLAIASRTRMRDVPLPEKAKEDLERTYVYESHTLQVGRMVYTIQAAVNDIAQFYIDTCPGADWRMVSVKQAAGGAELLFRKPGKKLEVSISPLAFGNKRLVVHLVPDEGLNY